MRLGPMLWTRRPEHWNFLGLRLGRTRLPARNAIGDAESPEGLPEYIERVERLQERYAMVDDADLRAAGRCGVGRHAGPPAPVADAMRGLAVQAVVRNARTQRRGGRRILRFGLGAPTGMAQMVAAHLEDRSPFHDIALADSAPTSAALLNALEEYVLRAEAGHQEGEPRGPFKEDWHLLLYGTDGRPRRR